MTIEFLRQSPTHKESTNKLSALLSNEDGRLFVLTGSVSRTFNIRSEVVEMIKWGIVSSHRELVFLVGVFSNAEGKYDEKPVADDLAALMLSAIREAKKQLRLSKISLNVRFFAAKKWHAKAIGFTGAGGKFLSVKAAIFGSTNFTHSARHGENFELDTFIQGNTPEHAAVLMDYAMSIGLLIQEAVRHKSFPGFEHLVTSKITNQIAGASFNQIAGSPENFWSLDT